MWSRIHNYVPYFSTFGGIDSLDKLYNDVHILAYFYHWGEKEILSLPIFKRKIYKELIEEQVKAENSDGNDVEEDY